VSAAWQFYFATLIVYTFVYIIAAAGLNLQFGITGVYNFAFIIFQAAGAYCTAVLSLGSPKAFGIFQTYILGLHLPFPLPLLASAVVAGVLGVGVGALTVRRLRADYLAIVMLVISLIATGLVTDYQGLFNGAAGLALIPQPFASLITNPIAYDWVYAAVAGIICVAVLLAARMMIESPLGRSLRAVRENENAAAALGKNVTALRLLVFGVGGAMAGVSGSLLASFTQAWSPSSWLYTETFVLFTALIVGGAGSNLGPVVGAVLVPVVLAEGSRYLPQFGPPTLVPSLEWIAIGLILLAFLWFWPRGIVPEPRHTFRLEAPPSRFTRQVPRAAAGTQASDPTREKAERGRPGQLTAAPGTPLLSVRGISCSFGGVRAVADVSFSALAGQITGLIGPNGAGKSTTLGIVAGAIRPTAGTIWFDGRDVTRLPGYQRARLGMIRTFQMRGEFDRLTVLENLLVAAPGQVGEQIRSIYSARQGWRRQEGELVEQARELLDRFGILSHQDAYAAELSGGQRRLMELARALMAKPRLLLLDEPMAGVSPATRGRLAEHLLEVAESGVGIVLVEHQLEFVENVCSHVLVLAQGRVIGEGKMAALREQATVLDAYLTG
jgi:ABC-type branched-subunit amino acid transport system ATPase component/ABC-type branched-subunit amino acid transport system permease subunit